MKSLELQVKEQGDVVLPAELATCGISLDEIGAVFVLFAAATGTIEPDHPVLADPQLVTTIAKLDKRGIVNIDMDSSGKVSVDIDITKV